MKAFLREMEHFFRHRPLLYVDVGAYRGDVFRELLKSRLVVHEAHLIEPNPISFAELQDAVARLEGVSKVHTYNVALGADTGRGRLHLNDTMSQIVAQGEHPAMHIGDDFAQVEMTTLDELAGAFGRPNISILKIDVEGYELEVLKGASKLLEAEAVDCLYIEAWANADSPHFCHYRALEDHLATFGYRTFKFFEQKHEWPEDSPLLRRINVAFLSRLFAAQNPYRLSRELSRAEQQVEALHAERADWRAEHEALKSEHETRRGEYEALKNEHEALHGEYEALKTEREALRGEYETLRGEHEVLRGEHKKLQGGRDRLQKAAHQKVRHAEKATEARIRSHLSYRLGAAIVHGSQSLGGMLSMPFALWRAVSRFHADQQTNSARARLKNPSAGEPGPMPPAAARALAKKLLVFNDKKHFANLLAVAEEHAGADADDHHFFLARFPRLMAFARHSAFDDVVTLADELQERFHNRHGELLANYGLKAYERLMIDMTTALSRVGRADDARALADRTVDVASRTQVLLRHRAELAWPHAPERSLKDLVEADTHGSLRPPSTLLRRYVEHLLAEPSKGPAPQGSAFREVMLVDALEARKRGDSLGYRRGLNAFFESQDLLPPLSASASAFAFDELVEGRPGDRSGPLVSVIMTSYNNAATLGYALRSIQQQTHANLEIFVVDDCSTDGTATLLAEFAAKDDRIRLMRTPENVGTYVAKNSAMAEAAGAYLTFHDSDDWAHPERIWRHVEEMEHNRATVATRSEWLRVDSTGELQFRRWGRKFQHANPASIFIREEARDQIGFFDSVRYGADSEYWFRLARVYGRRKARTLPLCLGFGRLHAASLTRSGSGAMGDENYSPVRGAYAAAYLDWHAKNAPEDLKLAPLTKKRPFRAPAEMTAGIVDVFREEMAAEAIDAATKNAQTARAIGPRPAAAAPAATPAFMFGISLASKRASGDWARTEELLGNTLRSLFNQSDDRFIVAIGGHERPSIPEMHDPRVMFIECDVAPPRKPEAYRRDKMRKRRLVAAVLRQRGGGYFFPLDADDLVHRDLVAHVLGDDNRAGYLIEHGYALDYINCRVAPIPGAWNVSFDRVCGSSAVLYFEPDELPCNGDADDQLYFNLFQSHAYWPIVAQEYQRPLSSVPFAAGVYVVNHAQNLSFKLQRTGIRTQNIIQAVADHVIDGGNELLRTDFGWKILDAKSA